MCHMYHLKNRIFSVLVLCIFSITCHLAHASTITVSPGVYAVTTETSLPNLNESLRYATTTTNQCLHEQEASSLFPILSQVSFVGCNLVGNQSDTEHSDFDLVCNNSQAATGTARFIISASTFRASLDVKMGGKNMKFSQRISARRIGPCN